MIGEAYAKVAIRVFDWFLPKNHKSRLRVGLLESADGMQENLRVLLKQIKGGDTSFHPKLLKYLRHYERQYRTNRKKLRQEIAMGQKIQIGDKLVELDERGILKATSKEIKHADGRVDVEIHIPCLKIQGKTTK